MISRNTSQGSGGKDRGPYKTRTRLETNYRGRVVSTPGTLFDFWTD